MDNGIKTSLQEELLSKGSVTLTAKSREEIYSQCQALVDSLPEGTKWTRTICQYHPDTFSFEQTVSITKK
jgi:hypothetical protein